MYMEIYMDEQTDTNQHVLQDIVSFRVAALLVPLSKRRKKQKKGHCKQAKEEKRREEDKRKFVLLF